MNQIKRIRLSQAVKDPEGMHLPCRPNRYYYTHVVLMQLYKLFDMLDISLARVESNTGVSTASLSMWRRGSSPRLDIIQRLLEAMGCTLMIVTLDEEEKILDGRKDSLLVPDLSDWSLTDTSKQLLRRYEEQYKK